MLVDRRTGSKELMAPLHQAGLLPELTELAFGDIAFRGRGDKDVPVDIGIELKTLTDLVGSLRTGRLAGHQLPGLRTTYDHSWLIVEGLWRHNEQGHVVTYQGKTRGWQPLHGAMTASELEKQCLTLELKGGLHVRYTNSRRDTVRFLGNLFRWWTDQALDKHTSHLALHQTPTLVPISDFRQVVCRFPGIGVRNSKGVEEVFKRSLADACNASVEVWANILTTDDKGKSRRLGEITAKRIKRFIHTGVSR